VLRIQFLAQNFLVFLGEIGPAAAVFAKQVFAKLPCQSAVSAVVKIFPQTLAYEFRLGNSLNLGRLRQGLGSFRVKSNRDRHFAPA
jgi:hypothetical protein